MPFQIFDSCFVYRHTAMRTTMPATYATFCFLAPRPLELCTPRAFAVSLGPSLDDRWAEGLNSKSQHGKHAPGHDEDRSCRTRHWARRARGKGMHGVLLGNNCGVTEYPGGVFHRNVVSRCIRWPHPWKHTRACMQGRWKLGTTRQDPTSSREARRGTCKDIDHDSKG